MGEDFITYDDLPINKNYIAELESLNIKIIRKLNWFNSVSADLTSDQIEIIKNLPYIKSIEPVKKLYFQNDPLLNSNPQLNKELDITLRLWSFVKSDEFIRCTNCSFKKY